MQVLSENFSNGLPTGWYVYSGNGITWSINDSLGVGQSACMWAKHDSTGEAWIRTPPLDLTQMNDLTVEFNIALVGFTGEAPDLYMKYRTDTQDPDEWIDLSSWGGANTENQITQSFFTRPPLNAENIQWVEISYDLGDINGELDSVRLWFGASINIGWALLDNVRVFGTPYTTGISGTTGEDHRLKVSPNPTTGHITITNAHDHISEIAVYSMTGQRMMAYRPANARTASHTLDLHALQAGAYLLRVLDATGATKTTSIIKYD